MLSDIVVYFPELRSDSERDYKRLLLAVEQHGFRFLFETLPAFGKHFDQCLANGRLIKSGLIHFGPIRHDTPIPRLFKGLMLRVFDGNGVLRSSPDVNCIRYIRQLSSAVKRFRIDCPESSTWEHVNDFFRTDSEVAIGSLNWDRGDFVASDSGNLQLGDYLLATTDDCNPSGEQSSTLSREFVDVLSTVQRTADIVVAEIGRFNPFD